MANIVKSFVGLGILAAPSGFNTVGFIPATVLISINAFLSLITIGFQTRAKEKLGPSVKSYTELGQACFGWAGLVSFSVTIFTSQFMCGIGYVMFFMQ